MKSKAFFEKLIRNKALSFFIICSFSFLLLSLMFLLGIFRFQELALSDFLYSEKNTLDNIIIVAIDDYSLQQIGRWPWDRAVYSKVLNHLDESRVIGIDIAFFESSDQFNDKALEAAINRNKKVVLVSEYSKDLYLEPAFNASAKIGHANLFIDPDGVLRAFPATMPKSKSFDVVIVEQYLNSEMDIAGKKLINFFGKSEAYTQYPFADVYNGLVNKSLFKDKIVLIGVVFPDSHDDHAVPISKHKRMSGVEVHANVVQTILTESYLNYESKMLVVLSLFIISLIVGLILYNFKMLLASIFCILLIMGYLLLALKIFDYGVIMNMTYPALLVIFNYLLILIFFYISEEKQKKWITNAFGSYVSHSVVKEIIKDPDRLRLGGEKKNLTVLFSDIRGFTTISESISPEKLVSLLNEYLTDMTEVIITNNGLVDKYIGDAIMAIWGAPLDDKDHAFNSCKSALLMKKKLIEMSAQLKKKFGITINIGIGINTGEMIVGNMGSKTRFDYTVIGDNVNFAARLESLTKQYKVGILISSSTYEQMKDKFVVRELDFVKVKGKTKPVKIYELVCFKEDLDATKEKVLMHFEKGISLYFDKKWKQAIAEFNQAIKLGKDEISEIYIERCKEFIKHPIKGKWDGVFEAKTK